MRVLTAILLFLAPAIVLAEPWCLVKNEKSFCNYETAEACHQSVAREGGSCRENYIKVGASGGAPYCIVTATYRECLYRSRDRCVRNAMTVNGGCVRNIELDLARKTQAQGGDCEDIACELGEASRVLSSEYIEQVIIEFEDESF